MQVSYDPLLKKCKLLYRKRDVITHIFNWLNKYFENEYFAKTFIFIPEHSSVLPKHLFQRLKRMFTKFIWNNRHLRLHMTLLYLPYDRGGLQCPNFHWYYWAVHLRTIMFYFFISGPPVFDGYGIGCN